MAPSLGITLHGLFVQRFQIHGDVTSLVEPSPHIVFFHQYFVPLGHEIHSTHDSHRDFHIAKSGFQGGHAIIDGTHVSFDNVAIGEPDFLDLGLLLTLFLFGIVFLFWKDSVPLRNGYFAEADGVFILRDEVEPVPLDLGVIDSSPGANLLLINVDGTGTVFRTIKIDGKGRTLGVVKAPDGFTNDVAVACISRMAVKSKAKKKKVPWSCGSFGVFST